MSIIVQNVCKNPTPVDHSRINTNVVNVDGELNIKATLIVCPVSLIDQWRREIETKTEPRLKVLVYHGASRTQNPYDLALYDGEYYFTVLIKKLIDSPFCSYYILLCSYSK